MGNPFLNIAVTIKNENYSYRNYQNVTSSGNISGK